MTADLKRRVIDPAVFFLLASLIVGLLYCVAVPYGAGFDEERHLIRIYYLSQNHLLPNFPNPTLYDDVIKFSYQRRLVQTPAFDLFEPSNFWKRFSREEKDVRYGVKTQSIYSPVIFLPQALIGKMLWWRLDFPVLPTILLMRIAGLLIYIVGAYFAIRVLPYGKWIFTALALFPAALYQAATLSADGFTAGVSFAFIGWVLSVYVRERSGVRTRSIWILFALSLLLGLAKPGAIILLPLLILLWQHPFPSRKWAALLWAGVFLSVAVNVGWWVIAARGSTFSGGGEQSLSSQSTQILSDPLPFIKLLLQGMVLTFPSQILGWMAAFGYGAGTVPGPVYFFVALFLVCAFLAEPQRIELPRRTRLFLIALFIFCCAAIYTIAFAPNYVTGGVLALAKHGRYYIPFAPLFFLSLAGLFVLREDQQKIARWVAVGSFLLATGWFLFGIYTTYYTYCGYDSYRGAKCVLPLYKNLEKEDMLDVPIQEGTPVKQTFTKLCGNLENVQVFVKSVPDPSQGALKFSLLDENRQVVASQMFPANTIAPGDYLTLPVPSGSNGTDYEIQLQSQGSTAEKAITVALTGSNYYPGRFSVNGTADRSDLLIHYTCTTP